MKKKTINTWVIAWICKALMFMLSPPRINKEWKPLSSLMLCNGVICIVENITAHLSVNYLQIENHSFSSHTNVESVCIKFARRQLVIFFLVIWRSNAPLNIKSCMFFLATATFPLQGIIHQTRQSWVRYICCSEGRMAPFWSCCSTEKNVNISSEMHLNLKDEQLNN